MARENQQFGLKNNQEIRMKILVLGGTGAMGTHIVKLLSEQGHKVYVTSRNNKKDTSNIKFLCGNAQELGFIDKILDDSWDAIVDFMNYTTVRFEERVNRLLKSTNHYVFLSSARVYADSDKPITEESERLLDVTKDENFLATDEYALAKARQEDLLFNSDNNNWTIIRPYVTYSENRLQLGVLEKEAWLYRALNNRKIAFSSEINDKYTTLTYGSDVANAIVKLIGLNNAKGEAFHITHPNSIKWSEVLDIYKASLEKKLNNTPRVSLQNLEQFNEWHVLKYQVKYDRLYNRRFDNSKIAQFVDISNFIDARLGIKNCLESFLNSPEFLYINWRSEAIKDRQLGDWTSMAEINGLKQKLKYLAFRCNFK